MKITVWASFGKKKEEVDSRGGKKKVTRFGHFEGRLKDEGNECSEALRNQGFTRLLPMNREKSPREKAFFRGGRRRFVTRGDLRA